MNNTETLQMLRSVASQLKLAASQLESAGKKTDLALSQLESTGKKTDLAFSRMQSAVSRMKSASPLALSDLHEALGQAPLKVLTTSTTLHQ